MNSVPILRKSDKLIDMLNTMTKESRAEFISELDEDELNTILYNWDIWARDEQLLFRRNEFVILARAGRGWGKTRFSSEAIIEWERDGFKYFGVCNASPAAVRDINVLGESGIIACSPPWNKPEYLVSKATLQWPSGASAKLFSGANPEQSRGYQSEKLLIDELFAYKYPEETYDNLSMGCRLGRNPQIVIPSTPKPTSLMKRIMAGKDTFIITGSTFDNKDNLADSFITNMEEKYGSSRLGRQELFGDILDDNQDAIFNREYVESNKITKEYFEEHVELVAIVVSVDPSVSNNKKSNETGIIIGGLGKNGHVYILEDASEQASPDVWAKTVVRNYNNYNCNYVLYEKNQGGLLVKTVIQQIDNTVPCEDVWAKQSKITRAEPVAVLYERGLVHHVGSFPTLEEQMCEYETGMVSPDRLDALVHLVSKLLITNKKRAPIVASNQSSSMGNIFTKSADTIFKGGNFQWPK